MLARRNALQQIIALAAAPAIIRVAPLMTINPPLATPEFYCLCKPESPVQGVMLRFLRSGADRGWLLVAENTTTKPLTAFSIRLLRGEERVVCTSTDLRPYTLREPPPSA